MQGLEQLCGFLGRDICRCLNSANPALREEEEEEEETYLPWVSREH